MGTDKKKQKTMQVDFGVLHEAPEVVDFYRKKGAHDRAHPAHTDSQSGVEITHAVTANDVHGAGGRPVLTGYLINSIPVPL